jgi:hypothetical protein
VNYDFTSKYACGEFPTELQLKLKDTTTALVLMVVGGLVGAHRVYIEQYMHTALTVPALLLSIALFAPWAAQGFPFVAVRFWLAGLGLFGVYIFLALVAYWITDSYYYMFHDLRTWQTNQYPVTHFEKQLLITRGVITREQAKRLCSFDHFVLSWKSPHPSPSDQEPLSLSSLPYV